MSMLSNLDLIRRVPLFSMLTNDQAQQIADSVVKRRFRRGELIVEHGRNANARSAVSLMSLGMTLLTLQIVLQAFRPVPPRAPAPELPL